jgi:hypothetical protein
MAVAIQIDQPPLANAVTNVKCANPTMAGQGSICACGTATKDGIPLNSVWAAVIPLLPVGQAPPASHTQVNNPTQTTNFDKTGTTGDWYFVGGNLVTNVPYDPPPVAAANYTFVVWCSFTDAPGTEFPKSWNIAAKGASATNCDGTPNPCGERLRLYRPDRATTVAVETAPRQYQVQGKGARGPLASLVNTTWALGLRAGGCGCAFAWDNEGDGIRVARVVLRPDGVISAEWNLTLVLNGRRAQYTCPAQEWKALGVNRLARASGDDGMPKTLIVTPV